MNANVKALMALARADVLRRAGDLDRAVVAAVAGWFGAPPTGESQLPGDLLSLLTGLGISESAAAEVGAMTAKVPVAGRTADGSPVFVRGMSAVERVASDEPTMRARYVVNASWRLSEAFDDVALRNEFRYLNDHLAAGENRRAAAKQIDAHGKRVLRWVTAGDDLVHPDCRRLEGRLFTATNLPDGLVPGGVRVGCRCAAEPWGHEFWAISEF